jgi:hypothetical protein
MTPENFVYWLQGYLELSNVSELSKEQTQIIKDHIKLVLDKKTPTRSTIFSHTSVNDTLPMMFNIPVASC